MQATGNPIRVLVVEDSEDDARMLIHELRKCGYEPAWERVETAGAMRAALQDKPWDFIFSDFMVPGFGGMEALQIAKGSGLGLPFVVISGAVGEEELVEVIKAGASDLMLKGQLGRLGSVVGRELASAAERQGMERAQIAWRAAFDALSDGILIHDAAFRILRANFAYAALARMPVQDVIGKPYWEVFPKIGGPLPGCKAAMGGAACHEEELELPGGDSYLARSFPVPDSGGNYLYCLLVLQDMTERNRVRDAVESGDRRFRSLIERASDLVAVLDAQGVITYISPSVRQLGGYEAGELLGRNFLELAHPDDLPLAREGLAGVLSRPDGLHTTEFRFRRKDGGFVVLESVVRNALGDPAVRGIVINSRDVTERKRAELLEQAHLRRTRAQALAVAAIAASEALLNGEVEALAAEITEQVAKVTGVERANVWLFNDDESELRCIDLYEATPARHSAGMVLKESEFRPEFHALKSAPYVNADDPLTDPRTSGYVESYLKPLRITSMLDAVVALSGRHLGLLCLEHVECAHHWEGDEIAFALQLADKVALALTIRARRRSQEALERNERYFRKLIEGGADAFFVIDQAGTVLYRSATGEKLTGWSDEEVVGKNMANFVVSGQVPLVQGAIARTIRNPAETTRLDLRMLRKDGTELEVAAVGRNLLADPDVGGLVVTVRDITERNRAESDLRWKTAFFEALVSSSADGILVVDAQGRKVLQNQRMVDLWKIPKAFADDADDTNQLRYVTDQTADPKAFVEKVLHLYAHPDETSRDEIVTRDGAVFDRYSAPVADANGHSYGRIWSFRDITERKRAAEKLRASFEGAIAALAATVEQRDPYTAGHQRRVATLAVAIGGELGFDEDRLTGLRVAGTIHDIGKISVPAEILVRPGRIGPLEFALIRSHAQVGYEIVKGVDFPWPVADAIHQHHERLDGSGYPQGLKGGEIILEARILAVADVVEAMSSHRPYRPGLGIDVALKEVEDKRGIWFDPAAVDACVRLFREKGFAFDSA